MAKGIRISPGVYRDPATGKTYNSKDGTLPGAGKPGANKPAPTPTPTGQAINANSVFGSSSTSVDDQGNVTSNQTLSPGNQGVVDQGQAAGTTAGSQLNKFVGSENFGKTWQDNGIANTKSLTDAVFNQATRRLEPRQAQGREQLQQQLANRGIPVGSDAWNNAVREQEYTFGDQYANAQDTATQKGFDFWNQQAQVGNQTAQTLQGVNQAGYYAPPQIDANAVFGTQQGTMLGNKQITSNEKIAGMNNDAALKAAQIRARQSGGGSGGQAPLQPSPFASGGLPNS